MNDNKDTDKLLDGIAAKIRNTPVPDYPGIKLPEPRSNLHPILSAESGTRRRNTRAAASVVTCCLAVLCAVALTISWPRNVDLQSDSIADTSDRSEPRVLTVDPAEELVRMHEQLDQLSDRLDQLESEVALREIQTDAAALLAEYTPRRSKAW